MSPARQIPEAITNTAIVNDPDIEAAVPQAMEGALHRIDDPLRPIPERAASNLGQVDRRSRVAVGILGSGEERALVRGFEDEPGERLPFRTADIAVRNGKRRAEGLGTRDGVTGIGSPRRPDGCRCGEPPGGLSRPSSSSLEKRWLKRVRVDVVGSA